MARRSRIVMVVMCALGLLLSGCGTGVPHRTSEVQTKYAGAMANLRTAINGAVGPLIWDEDSATPAPAQVSGRCAVNATLIGTLTAIPTSTTELLAAVNTSLTQSDFPTVPTFTTVDGHLELTSSDTAGATITIVMGTADTGASTIRLALAVPARPGECHGTGGGPGGPPPGRR